MSPERPFLTARWTDLLLLNFTVPAEVIARLAPAGTEPDLFDGQAYVSVVGFLFRDARFVGLRFPGHGRFEEVNLRYYVRRRSATPDAHADHVRRGVVFVREIAPRPAVAATARWIYHESYVTRRMRSEIRRADHTPAAGHTPDAGDVLSAGDVVGYAWRTGRWGRRRWNRASARVAATPQLPTPGTLTEFIIEHYWAYVRTRDGATSEYRVAHRPWRVAPASDVVWDCDLAATYDHTPLAEYLAAAPALAFVADGSPVQVFRGRRLEPAELAAPAAASRVDQLAPYADEAVIGG